MTATVVTAANAQDIADQINSDFSAGVVSTVNGGSLKSRFGSPVARAWQNGTVSVTVVGRSAKINTVYIKIGGTVSSS